MAAISDFEVEVEQINRRQSEAKPRIRHSLPGVSMCVYCKSLLYLHVTVSFCPLIYTGEMGIYTRERGSLLCVLNLELHE